MTAPLFKDLATGIDSLDLDENAKEVFRAFLRSVRVAHGDGDSIEREERQAFAADLLVKRVPRCKIRDRLEAQFHLSRRQAYRVIEEALSHLKLCHEM